MKIVLKISFIFCLISSACYASNLTYDDVLNKALNNSFELKMSSVDIGISKAQLKAARSEFYPSLSMQFNTEYNKDLADGRGSYAYAGNTMIVPYTQYKNMLYMTLSYNLFDFGVTGKKVNIAKKEFAQKKIAYDLQVKDLKLKVLDLYTNIQKHNNEIAVKSEIVRIYETMFTNKERIFKAGMDSRLSVMDEAVKIAKAQNDVENSKLELKNALRDLSYFTSEIYEISNLTVNYIDEKYDNILPVSYDGIMQSKVRKENYYPELNPDFALETEYYDLEIAKKKDELTILKRQLLPSFRFYTGYSLYGQNPGQYWQAVEDIGQRSFIVGISSTYVFFDGFKNRANREKTALEIEKLKYEKEKKLADLKKNYDKSFQSFESFNEELSIKKTSLENVKNKLDALNRLTANKLAEQNQLLGAKAELLSEEYELEQNIINITSKIEEMKIMIGEDI